MTKFLNNPVISLLLLITFLAICFLVLGIATSSTMDGVEWQEEIYRVQSGDSLWTIANEYCPDGVDRREWIGKIRELNGLPDSLIYPGQALTVLVAVKEG